MELDKKTFKNLIDLLEDFNYLIFSGFAVKLYCDPDRDCEDIDIIVKHEQIEELADKLKSKVRRRKKEKRGGVRINDYGFETKYEDIKLDVSSGFPRKRFKEGTLDKLFENKRRVEYLGRKVNLIPVEDLIIMKADFFQEKDKRDLRKLKKCDYDKELLLEMAKDWSIKEKIAKRLASVLS